MININEKFTEIQKSLEKELIGKMNLLKIYATTLTISSQKMKKEL